MNKFIVLDIESPNENFSSISAIGILVIENYEIKEKIYSLINPEEEFDDYIMDMTGITPEMVEDKPKFNEFWPEIEELLVTNTIIGHNITYDLSVISNSLDHYNIPVPEFKYICTLKLSRKILNLDSYALTDIMSSLNVDYNAHNALADAEVTHLLFKHLNDIKPITILNQKYFNNHIDNQPIEEELIPSINELYGSILELKYKENITSNQLQIFDEWITNNMEYSSYKYIEYIILKLKHIIAEDHMNKEDLINISTMVTSISKSEKYSKEELNCQVLTGILKMLKSDDKINKKELDFLNKWLTYYNLEDKVDITKLEN